MLTLAWPTAHFVRIQNTTPIYTVRFKVNASIHDKQLKYFRGGGEGGLCLLPSAHFWATKTKSSN